MSAEEIRRELVGLKDVRRGLESDLAQARDDTATLLRKARTTPGLSISEAADLVGVSRVTAHALLKD